MTATLPTVLWALAVACAGCLTPAALQAQAPGETPAEAAEAIAGAPRFDAAGTEYLPLAEAAAPAEAIREVYFATNRDPIPQANPTGFGRQVRAETRFGKARLVTRNGVWQLLDFELERPPLPEMLALPAALAAVAVSPDAAGFARAGLSADQPLAEFAAAAARPNTDVFVYVHGAGHDFESALSTTARLAELYARPGQSLVATVFTYPTNGVGMPLNYFADRRDAGMSGFAMAAGFQKLTEFLGELRLRQPSGQVWLIAHSLGAYASRVAVQSIFEQDPLLRRVFDLVLLMGGDEDHDSLSVDAKMGPLLDLTDTVVVYFARNDALLQLSSLVNRRMPIGLSGPHNVDRADYGGTTVLAVDARAFSAVNDRWKGHGYYTRSPRVISDVASVLEGAPPDQIPGRRQIGPRTFRLVGD